MKALFPNSIQIKYRDAQVDESSTLCNMVSVEAVEINAE